MLRGHAPQLLAEGFADHGAVVTDLNQRAQKSFEIDDAGSARQFAAAVNPVLIDLIGLDTSASYAQIQSALPSAVPTLPAPGSDGSYTTT